MTTIQDRPTTRQGPAVGSGKCANCSKCQDGSFCSQRHPQYDNLHPLCRKCKHCALRGKHDEDASDLLL